MITTLAFFFMCALADDADFKAARAALDAFEYDSAVTRFEAVVKKKSLSSQDRANAWVWLGLALAENNNPERASSSFDEALSIDPWVGLPKNSSPKIRTMFDAARDRARTRTQTSPKPVAIEAKVTESPLPRAEPVQESSSLLPVGVGVLSVGGVISLVGGAAWGVGLALYSQGEATKFQSDAKELDDQSSTAQVVGQISVAVGALTLAGGGVMLGMALSE